MKACKLEMVDRTRELEFALGNGVKKVEDNEKETVILQRRSLRLVRDISAGEVLYSKDLVPLRPCPTDAIPLSSLSKITGKSAAKDLKKGNYLRAIDIE